MNQEKGPKSFAQEREEHEERIIQNQAEKEETLKKTGMTTENTITFHGPFYGPELRKAIKDKSKALSQYEFIRYHNGFYRMADFLEQEGNIPNLDIVAYVDNIPKDFIEELREREKQRRKSSDK